MTPMATAAIVVAAACYGISSVTDVQLSSGRRISGAAAFGPALVTLSPSGYDVAPIYVVVAAGLGAQALAMAIRGVAWPRFSAGATLLIVSAGAFLLGAQLVGGGSLGDGGYATILIVTMAASVPYAAGDLLLRIRRHRSLSVSVLRSELRWAAAIYAVLLSTSGLIVLAFRSIGSMSFPTLLLVFVFAQHQLQLFAEAKTTYAQTVRAMGRLTERAGYVDSGHHERVASLCVAMATRLGLEWDRIRELELVALVHEVGAVTLSEPSDIERVDPSYVIRHSVEILEEAGHVASQTRYLWSETDDEPSLEAQILHAACACVSGQAGGRANHWASHTDPRAAKGAPNIEQRVLDALAVCIEKRPSESKVFDLGVLPRPDQRGSTR